MGQYDLEGYTASGAPYYKKAGASTLHIYWDPDCDGGGGTARWILDSDAPSTSAAEDLDGDGSCNYNARIDSSASWSPPSGTSTWRIVCDGDWIDNDLTTAPCPPPACQPPA